MTRAFDSRFYRWVLWMGLLAAILAAGLAFRRVDLGMRMVSHGILDTLLAILFGLSLWNRRRPALEVSNGKIEFGNVLDPRRQHVTAGEVARVSLPEPPYLVIEKISGEQLKVPLRLVRKADRAEARAAIEAELGVEGR